jgi:hypothetical protein
MNDNELIWEAYEGNDESTSIVPSGNKKNYDLSAKIASEVVKKVQKGNPAGLEWLLKLIETGGGNVTDFFDWLETKDAIDVHPSDSIKKLK